jgi:hypothetical protein
MKHLKNFLESAQTSDIRLQRRKSDMETTNKQMITKEWMKNHPFEGVTEIRCHENSIDIYFGRDSYLSIHTGMNRKMSDQNIEWRMMGSDTNYILDNKEEFMSWCDKLLIKCDLDRSVLKDLERKIEQSKRKF